MPLPLVAVPEEVRRAIEPFVPGLPWEDIELHFQRVPQALSPTALVLVAPPDMPAALFAAAMAIGTDVYIDPTFVDFQSAAGVALVVHEMVHVAQYLANPDSFLAEYNRANQDVPDGQPWLNPYEWEAYSTETVAYCAMVASGVPPGSWVPTGLALGLWRCPI